MKRYLFVALALVVLLIAPVCAYTQLAVWNETIFQTNGWPISGMMPLTGTNYTSVTKVHVDTIGSGVYRGTSGTCTATNPFSCQVSLCNSTTHFANVLITGDLLASDDYSNGWIEAEIDWNETSGVPPGSSGLTFYPGYDTCTGTLTDYMYLYSKHSALSWDNANYNFYFHVAGSPMPGGWVSYGGFPDPSVSSFTCTPTSQYPDEAVVCTDTSTGNPTTWYWTVTAESLGVEGFSTGNSQNFTWYSHYPGLYSVNLWTNTTGGGDWENKTNYVSISENATPNNCNIPVVPGLIRSWAQCVDSQTSGAVAGCDLSLYDLEGGAWSNVTDRFDGTWCIDTYPAHHFNAYGSADGYTPDPTYRLNLNVNEHVVYELLMHPGYVPPAAEGKVWVYGIVNDADTGAAIEGAVFRLDASGQTSKSDTTDAAGSMHIQWVNKTQTTATASKAGYGTISKVFTTSDYGPDTVRIELHKSIVTPTATATTGPGGTVPTTANPWQNPDGSFKDGYSQYQGQAIMNLLAVHGYNLVLLCIFVTMMALLGFKFGK